MKALQDLANIFNTSIQPTESILRVNPTRTTPLLPTTVTSQNQTSTPTRVIEPNTTTPTFSPKSRQKKAPRMMKTTPITLKKIHQYSIHRQLYKEMAVEQLITVNTEIITIISNNWANAIIENRSGGVLKYRHLCS